ncbi:AMP-binding protein [Dactylosporangium siamense]|uniref:AMP-dependent synthetase n=1 Tax=Dactylosporangium siamense TaxID=685454 RepID=A0A919UDP6_9ACTN|nr:AMP-binding protein [Dactylosporangium siamense]GIG48146.1 AMP-dependent synthetase [Dactylosporangium siamense]
MVNLARLAEASLDRHGDYPALCFEGAWHTSGESHDRATRLAGGLRELGVRPGDRVAVVMANCPEVSQVYQAVWRAGAVVTPVVFLVTADELGHVLRDSGAVAVVTSPELLPKFGELLKAGNVPAVVVGTPSFEALLAADPAPITDRGPDELAALLYTGGTTGRSKGVALTHANLAHAGRVSREAAHTPGLNTGITALPLSHSYGLMVTVGAMQAVEPPVAVLQRWFEPAGWLRLAAEQRAQTAAVVPSMIVMLLGQPLAATDLSALRFVFSGAAPLPPAAAEAFERLVPSARVLEGYGCTETGGIVSGSPLDAPRRGTVGKPLEGIEVRLGDDGEILVRGPNVMRGYWGTDSGIADGWFATGDVGTIDGDGYLSIVDRKKDLIIRGGFNVYPRDVEDVLTAHPAVAMAAVVGRPDERLGEEVVAFVSLTGGEGGGAQVTAEDLDAYARAHLAPTKRPREIHVLEQIPLTSVGKLNRKALRALL